MKSILIFSIGFILAHLLAANINPAPTPLMRSIVHSYKLQGYSLSETCRAMNASTDEQCEQVEFWYNNL